jgi:hypothetical protein
LTRGEDFLGDMEKIVDMIHRMDPEHAMNEIGQVLKSLFPVVSEDARGRFLLDLVGESENDKVSSLVHL